jgi:alpha-tubulin suppressor-like RCC1 family protein
VPGLNVSGVVTATSFSGNCTGTASSIVKGTNVVVGVMTASSFVGDVTGNVTGIGSNTDNLDVGIVTATSFAGNFTGIGSGLTGTPNVVAGVVTATKFVGNTPGTVSKLSDGTNINVGVLTATGGLYGDGSGLTGAGSTAFISNVATASTSETVINLNDGNIILYKGGADSTVSFANTATAEDVTFIRDLNHVDYSVSFATGGIVLDGDDYVKSGWTGASQLGTYNFTIEYFWNGSASGSYTQVFGVLLSNADNGAWRTGTRFANNNCVYFARGNGSGFDHALVDANVNDGNWHHLVFMRKDGVIYIYIDGIKQTIATDSSLHSTASSPNISGTCSHLYTLEPYVGYNTRDSAYATGTVSNIRVTRRATSGQNDEAAVYPANSTIRVPSAPLTAVNTGGFLLAQSTSDVMANGTGGNGSWGEYGTQGDPTSFDGTVGTINSHNFSTDITWPSSIRWQAGTPTLIGTDRYTERGQVFHFNTCDAGGTWYGYEEVKADVTTYSAYSWGYNNYGGIGQNNTVQYSSPVQVTGRWTKIVTGSQGSAGIKPINQLWTWGQNAFGGLGQNNIIKYSSPVQVPGTTWSDISMSEGDDGFSLAAKTDGTLWTWGSNEMGMLGQNQAKAQLNAVSSPIQIPGTNWTTSGYKVNNATQAGAFCIKQDNTLWVWGSASSGGLGLNAPPSTNVSSPTQIPGSWSKVANNIYKTAGIKTDGTLWSWGYNLYGGLGLNDRTFRSSPTQIGSGTDWSDCAFHFGGGVAVKTDGTMWSWGISYNGASGRNTTGPGSGAQVRSSPVQVPGTTWYRVTGGFDGAHIATKTDNTLWSWGANAYGDLGQNNRTYYSSPVQIGSDATWNINAASSQGSFVVLKSE